MKFFTEDCPTKIAQISKANENVDSKKEKKNYVSNLCSQYQYRAWPKLTKIGGYVPLS